MEEQKSITNMGGTMRLGAYECVLDPNSKYIRHIRPNIFRNVIVIVMSSTMTIRLNLKRLE